MSSMSESKPSNDISLSGPSFGSIADCGRFLRCDLKCCTERCKVEGWHHACLRWIVSKATSSSPANGLPYGPTPGQDRLVRFRGTPPRVARPVHITICAITGALGDIVHEARCDCAGEYEYSAPTNLARNMRVLLRNACGTRGPCDVALFAPPNARFHANVPPTNFSDLSPNEAHVNITIGGQRRDITKYAPGNDLRSGRGLCSAAACVLLKAAEEGRCWLDHALQLSGVITLPQKSGLSCNLPIDHQRQRSSISHTPSSRGCQGRWEATAADTRRCIPRGDIHSCRDSRLSCATPPRRELHILKLTAVS